MIRIFSICSALIIATLGLVSCDKEPAELNHYVTDTSGPTPTLEGFNQLTVLVPGAVAVSGSSSFTHTWVADETFSVYESDGQWVADFKINDASTSVSVFTVVGDTRLDDDTKYVAVYPSRASDQETYEDYVTAVKASSYEQIQVGDTFDHLKDENYMEIEFMGDNPITFEHKKNITKINFELDDTTTPAFVKLEDGDTQSYILNFETSKATLTKVSYTAYMMINPIATTDQERTLTFSICASDGTELIVKDIKTTVGFSEGSLCSVDVTKGTVEVGIGDGEGDTDTGTGNSGDNEDLTLDDGTWL